MHFKILSPPKVVKKIHLGCILVLHDSYLLQKILDLGNNDEEQKWKRIEILCNILYSMCIYFYFKNYIYNNYVASTYLVYL